MIVIVNNVLIQQITMIIVSKWSVKIYFWMCKVPGYSLVRTSLFECNIDWILFQLFSNSIEEIFYLFYYYFILRFSVLSSKYSRHIYIRNENQISCTFKIIKCISNILSCFIVMVCVNFRPIRYKSGANWSELDTLHFLQLLNGSW